MLETKTGLLWRMTRLSCNSVVFLHGNSFDIYISVAFFIMTICDQ